MPDGWIILDKPIGLGSTQAVGAVKRNCREAGFFASGAKVKVGHGGTLDPLASGVLPIALGEATKLCGRMLDASKEYEFTVQFGSETDTLDLEGKVVAQSAHRPTLAEVEAILPRFTGPIEQVPPAFSALMVDGQRAYDLARKGAEVVLAVRRIEVFSLRTAPTPNPSPEGEGLRLRSLDKPLPFRGGVGVGAVALFDAITLPSATFSAHVSKGTYIRSLARDIARALGTVGHVTMLRRTRAGPFTLERAISLDNLNDVGKGAPLENVILPLEAGLDDIPALTLSPEQASMVRQGRVLTGLTFQDGVYWAKSGARPLALMELSGGDARVLRGFNLPDVAE